MSEQARYSQAAVTLVAQTVGNSAHYVSGLFARPDDDVYFLAREGTGYINTD